LSWSGGWRFGKRQISRENKKYDTMHEIVPVRDCEVFGPAKPSLNKTLTHQSNNKMKFDKKLPEIHRDTPLAGK
jgi:hypothetical protein